MITVYQLQIQCNNKHSLHALVFCIAMLWLPISNAQGQAPEHILWQKTPIEITLPVGKERWVSFPETVEVINQNHELTFDSLHITNNAGTVYFKALKAFAPSRFLVHLLKSNTVVLLDINAVDNPDGDNTPLSILLPTPNDDADNASQQSTQRTNPIALVRFAIGQVYPTFAQDKQLPDVHRVPLRSSRHVVLFYGANTMATPLASWRSGNWYVSVIIIQNSLKKWITLDPRNAHGNWSAMSLFPRNQLAPLGQPTSVTTAMVLSHQPFYVAFNALPVFSHPSMTG